MQSVEPDISCPTRVFQTVVRFLVTQMSWCNTRIMTKRQLLQRTLEKMCQLAVRYLTLTIRREDALNHSWQGLYNCKSEKERLMFAPLETITSILGHTARSNPQDRSWTACHMSSQHHHSGLHIAVEYESAAQHNSMIRHWHVLAVSTLVPSRSNSTLFSLRTSAP